MASDDEQPQQIWTIADLLERIAEFLGPNDVACVLRPLNKVTAVTFANRTVVRLSQPVPPHAFARHWADPGVQRRLNLKQRRDLVRLTASSGSISNLQVAFDCIGCCACLESAMAAAAAAGHLDACKLLLDRGCACDVGALVAAARAGRLDIVQWMHLSVGMPFTLQALEAAATAGHHPVCDWLVTTFPDDPDGDGEAGGRGQQGGGGANIPRASLAAAAAAAVGDVPLMELLLSRRPPPDPAPELSPEVPDLASCAALIRGVASGCDLATLEWLHQVWLDGRAAEQAVAAAADDVAAQQPQPQPLAAAAAVQQPPVLAAAAAAPAAGQPPPPPAAAEPPLPLPQAAQEAVVAAAAGSATADWAAKLEWLVGRGYPRAAAAWAAAAAASDEPGEVLSRFTALQEREFPRPRGLGATVARRHVRRAVEFLEFLKPVEPWFGREAAQHACDAGDVASLQALQARGAEIHSRDNLRRLAASGSAAGLALMLPLLEAAEAQRMARVAAELEAAAAAGRPPRPRPDTVPILTRELFAAGAGSGRLEVLEWLRERGCPWDGSAFAAAAGAGPREALDWLVERGCPMGEDGEAYVLAAGNGDLATLEDLRRLGCPWGPFGRAFTGAAAWAAPLSAMRWLAAAGCPVDWHEAAVAAALRGRRPDVLGWIREQSGGATGAVPESWGEGGAAAAAAAAAAAGGADGEEEALGPLGPVTPEASERDVIIVDNGGQPFLVRISYTFQLATVYRSRYISNDERDSSEVLHTFRFQRVFIGLDPRERKELAASEAATSANGAGAAAGGSNASASDPAAGAAGTEEAKKKPWWYGGNSVLIDLGRRRYVYVGSEVYSFTALDDIVDYVSTMGNSAVPYPFAIGTDNVYCFVEPTYLPKHILERFSPEDREDPYGALYNSEVSRWLPGADPHAGPSFVDTAATREWGRRFPLPGLDMLQRRPMWGWP